MSHSNPMTRPCVLDFLTAGPTPPDFQVGADGDVIAELHLMEYFQHQAALKGHSRDYTCAVAENPVLACLDIGSATTLDNQIVNATTHGAGVIHDTLRLFGGDTKCDNRAVGDGVVSTYDVAIILWYAYKVSPYDVLSRTPSDVVTVSARSGVSEQCGDSTTTIQWMTSVATDYCYFAGTPSAGVEHRRLAENLDLRRPLPPKDVVPEVKRWSNVPNQTGNWFRISVPGTQMAMTLMLDGVYSKSSIELNNGRYPPYMCTDCVPTAHAAQRYKLLFARRYEYSTPDIHYTTAGCALILAGFGARDSIVGQTLGIRQDPVLRACPFDLFLWVPHKQLQPSSGTVCSSGFGVLAGSSSMDAIRSLYIRQTVCALEYPFEGFDAYWDGIYPPTPPYHPGATSSFVVDVQRSFPTQTEETTSQTSQQGVLRAYRLQLAFKIYEYNLGVVGDNKLRQLTQQGKDLIEFVVQTEVVPMVREQPATTTFSYEQTGQSSTSRGKLDAVIVRMDVTYPAHDYQNYFMLAQNLSTQWTNTTSLQIEAKITAHDESANCPASEPLCINRVLPQFKVLSTETPLPVSVVTVATLSPSPPPTPSPYPPQPPATPSGQNMSTGAVIGIVLGSIFGSGIVILVSVVAVQRISRHRSTHNLEGMSTSVAHVLHGYGAWNATLAGKQNRRWHFPEHTDVSCSETEPLRFDLNRAINSPHAINL